MPANNKLVHTKLVTTNNTNLQLVHTNLVSANHHQQVSPLQLSAHTNLVSANRQQEG